MRLDRDVADVIRRLARYEGRKLDELLSDMVALYCKSTHPDLELVYEEDSASTDERRSGKRRGAGHKKTGKPIPGTDRPGINRRKAGERRKKSATKKKR